MGGGASRETGRFGPGAAPRGARRPSGSDGPLPGVAGRGIRTGVAPRPSRRRARVAPKHLRV